MACEVNVSSPPPLMAPLVSRLLPCPPSEEDEDQEPWQERNDTLHGDGTLQRNKSWILLLSGIPLLTLLGNLLVCLSVWKEKSLQTVTNYFTVSLAVADIMVALLVMPLAIYVEVRNGVWLLGDALCDTWVAFDVMCCTASILNLTAISIDRFIAVTQPLKYAKHKKNSNRVLVTVGLTWLISVAVSSPIALGLNYTDRRRSTPWRCTFYNADFLICSSLTSFYIPCLLMIFLYYKTLRAIVCRAKRKRMRARNRSIRRSTSLRLWGYSEVPTKNSISKFVRCQGGQTQNVRTSLRTYDTSVVDIATNGQPQTTLKLEVFQRSNGRSSGGRGKPGKRDKDERKARTCTIPYMNNAEHNLDYVTPEQDTTTSVNEPEIERLLHLGKSRTTFSHGPLTLNEDSTQQGHNSSVSPCAGAVDSNGEPVDDQWTTNNCEPPLMSTLSAPSAGSKDYLLSKAHSCATDCDRQVHVVSTAARRRAEGRRWFTKQERKATKTLAIVLGVFLFCWLPFFAVNTMNAFCIRFDLFTVSSICNIRPTTFSLFVWFGYVNSCLNPFIYTVFNTEFRKAFKKRLQALCK